MDKLISDNADAEVSARVKDVLRALCIDDWQSEPHYQWQNFAERRWKHLKYNIQWYMNLKDVQPNCWFLCAQWVADVMNLTAEKSLGWRTPLEVLTGETQDISILLCFLFWDPVYIKRYEEGGYLNQVGFSWTTHRRSFTDLVYDLRKKGSTTCVWKDLPKMSHLESTCLASEMTRTPT